MCQYATDVSFKQSHKPGRSVEEVKKCFSAKHKLYGFKVVASVLFNGLEISVSNHYPGSVPDIEIMREMLHFHDDALEKSGEDLAIMDIGHMNCILIDGESCWTRDMMAWNQRYVQLSPRRNLGRVLSGSENGKMRHW